MPTVCDQMSISAREIIRSGALSEVLRRVPEDIMSRLLPDPYAQFGFDDFIPDEWLDLLIGRFQCSWTMSDGKPCTLYGPVIISSSEIRIGITKPDLMVLLRNALGVLVELVIRTDRTGKVCVLYAPLKEKAA